MVLTRLRAVSNPIDPFLILIPAGVAAVVGLLRGRKYDAELTGQASVESSL
jgi:hypothetical protein